MDPNTAMEVAGESAKALSKLGDIVLKFLGPRATRKQADADRYADQQKINLIRDNPDMEIVYTDGKINARKRTPEVIAYRAEQRLLNEAIRQEENIENILENATVEIQSLTNVSDSPIEDDWVARFFNIVKDINSEEMQLVWGKILAGEIAMPGSFSLRTLETLRNFSQTEAQMFQKILPLIMKFKTTYFLISDENLLKKYGVSYNEILVLDECGILNSSGMVSCNINFSGPSQEMFYTNEQVAFINYTDEKKEKLVFGIYAISTAGMELCKILQQTCNNNYMFDVAEQIKQSNLDLAIRISIHKVEGITDNNIQYTLNPIKTF